MTTALIQSGRFAQRSDDFLPRPFGSADRADQSPVFAGLTVGDAAIAAQKHDWIMPQGCAAGQPAVPHYRALRGFHPQQSRENPVRCPAQDLEKNASASPADELGVVFSSQRPLPAFAFT